MPTGKVSIRWATASATHAMPVTKPSSSAHVTGSPKSSKTVLVNTTRTIALLGIEGLLRAFLNHLDHDPAAVRLANEGGSAFVSLSLRPFVVAALADQDAKRPALVVVGDDRAARDLAADLRAWLAPRPGPLLPEPRRRLRVAPDAAAAPRRPARRRARRADGHARGLRAAGRRHLARPRCREKVPDPKLRPHGFMLRVGDLLDLDETAQQLVAAGYQRVDQVEDRGQFAIRGGLLDVYPATEERAVRVDLFDIEIEALRWFSTFTQRSLGETDCVEISPAAELAPEHRELAEIAADATRTARTSPSCCRSSTSARCWT